MPNITLKRFMIFNSSEGHHESQEGDKLLYHWTKEAPDNKVSLAEQIDDICLCDASVNVSSRLKCDISEINEESDTNESRNHSNPRISEGFKSSQKFGKSLVLTFEKTLVIIAEVEPEQSIWMATHVAPQVLLESHDSTVQSDAIPNSIGDSSCIPTDAIERVMNNMYDRFCLLNGSFQMIADEVRSHRQSASNESNEKNEKSSIRNRIRSICEEYFNNVLPNIHLNSIVSNIASLYNYILYLDLKPITLMKVNSFINHLVCIDARQIRHTIVIFNDQLLWSNLNMYDTRLLYNYLVSVLIRDALQEELSKEVEKVRRIKENMPIYLTDLFTSEECSYSDETMLIIPDDHQIVGSEKNRKLNKLYLTVFRSSNNMTLGLIFSEPNLTDLTQKCEQILTSDSRLGVIPLASLAQAVGQSFLKANSYTVHHQQQPQQSSHQNLSTSSVASNSGIGSRKNVTSTIRSIIPVEQKYIYMDRLFASISLPLSMDMLSKEHLLLSNIDNSNVEVQPKSKKIRLIKYMIDLEPEIRVIKQQSGSSVEEFFGKTMSDSWLTVTNSKYKTIYSIHNTRNAGLSEAQQSATNLKSVFAGHRL